MGCRDVVKGQQAADEIKRLTKNDKVRVEHLDLTNLSSIAQFVNKIDKAHVLVNNAGAMFSTKQMVSSCELTSFTNHIGPFYLTNLMFDKLQRTAKEDKVVCRVINVASRLEKNAYPNKQNKNNRNGNDNNTTSTTTNRTTTLTSTHIKELEEKLISGDQKDLSWLSSGPEPYSMWQSYANSKLCNLLFTSELSKKPSDGVVAIAVTPGMVNTNLSRFLPWWQRILVAPIQNMLLKTSDQGARPVIALASADDTKARSMNGGFYGVGTGTDTDALLALSPSSAAQSQELARAIWKNSEMLVQDIIKEEMERKK